MQRFFLFDLKKDKKTFLKISILKGKQIVRHAESAQAMRFMTEAATTVLDLGNGSVFSCEAGWDIL